MMGAAFVLSICSTSDAFIARNFINQFSVGSILGFLILGPMIDIKNLIMLLGNFKAGYVVRLVGSLLLIVFTVLSLFIFLNMCYVKVSVYALILICPFMFKGLFRLKPVKANIFSYVIFTLTLVTALFIPPLQFNAVNGGNKVSLQSNSLEADTSAVNNDGYNTESSNAEDSSTDISSNAYKQ